MTVPRSRKYGKLKLQFLFSYNDEKKSSKMMRSISKCLLNEFIFFDYDETTWFFFKIMWKLQNLV